MAEILNINTEQLRNDYTSMGVTLAARNSEIEQLRKERDELARAVMCVLDYGDIGETDEECKYREELAKKVSKNGNA